MQLNSFRRRCYDLASVHMPSCPSDLACSSTCGRGSSSGSSAVLTTSCTAHVELLMRLFFTSSLPCLRKASRRTLCFFLLSGRPSRKSAGSETFALFSAFSTRGGGRYDFLKISHYGLKEDMMEMSHPLSGVCEASIPSDLLCLDIASSASLMRVSLSGGLGHGRSLMALYLGQSTLPMSTP